MATINTHDMPMFAAWWAGEDVPDRVAMGLMTDAEARDELASRATCRKRIVEWLRGEGRLAERELEKSSDSETKSVLFALLRFLAASPAESVLVNLEDLWLERMPQNTPGTSVERPNWRRKSRFSLEQMRREPDIAELFSTIDRLRVGRSTAVGAAPAVSTSAKG
jgi:4-alpha-glucanotransferase